MTADLTYPCIFKYQSYHRCSYTLLWSHVWKKKNNNNNNHHRWRCCSAGNETRALYVLQQLTCSVPWYFQEASYHNSFLLSLLQPYFLPWPFLPFNIMLNPSTPVLLRPFRPRCSIIHKPPRPCKKRLRLYMFPLNLHFRCLTGPQSARLRIVRKSLVQRLRQLKQCKKLLEQSSQELDQMQSLFINLAQQVHHIHAAVDYDLEITGPPFDGYTYIWKWKSIIIRFSGSNFYYRIIFDFTRYISPAISEYALVVYWSQYSGLHISTTPYLLSFLFTYLVLTYLLLRIRRGKSLVDDP